MFTEIRNYQAVVPSLHDFTVRICDCKMASQNLYTPGSQVQTQRTFMQFSTLRLHCPSLHVWRENQCVNARALGLAFPFVLRKVCASLRFNFRCVCAEAGTNFWHYFTFNLHVSFIKKKATWPFIYLNIKKHDSDIQICRPFSDGVDISTLRTMQLKHE